jgi:hypothetical protein
VLLILLLLVIIVIGVYQPRTFVPRALLYNDGGFDVSPDGKTLCACAEYWLPEGVKNAMELLHREEMAYRAEVDREELERQREADPSMAESDSHSAVSAALTKLKSITSETRHVTGRSPSFRDSMIDGPRTPTVPRTPTLSAPSSDIHAPSMDYIPRTPENLRPQQPLRLSPPSPPRGRFTSGLYTQAVRRDMGGSAPVPDNGDNSRGLSSPPQPPPPPAAGAIGIRPPHPLSVISTYANPSDFSTQKGRYVPHVVTISLDTSPFPDTVDLKIPRGKPYGAVAKGYRPRLGQLLEACPLDPTKASAVTCVKFSPSTDFCLIGYGVREPSVEGGGKFHPVTALYRIRGGMSHISTMLSGDDDVNIARFHPDSGYGFVYGTKQGRVRIQSPRPWMFYNT